MLVPAGFVGRVGLGSVSLQPSEFPWLASSGALPSGSTFTRASNGTQTSNAGVLETKSTNVARFTHVYNGASYDGAFLLMEGAATNLLLSSADLRTIGDGNPIGAWGASNCITSTSATSSPISGVNYTQLLFTNTFGLCQQTITTTSNVIHAEAAYISKLSALRKVRMDFCDSGSSNRVSAIVDLDAETATLQASGTGSNADAFVEYVDHGPNDVLIRVRGRVATTTPRMQFSNATYGNNLALLVTGADLKLASSFSSYIPTTTTSATRAEDFVGLPLSKPTGNSVKFTFSDDTTQTLTGIANLGNIGGSSLTKSLIKKIEEV